jgi:hypothetical protein
MSETVLPLVPTKGLPRYFEINNEDGWRGTAIPARKAPYVTSGAELKVEIEYTYFAGVKIASRPETEPETSKQDEVHSPITYNDRRYPRLYHYLGYLVFIIIIGGIIGTIVEPSAVTELGLPVGFTLWAILAYLLRRSDRLHPDA